MPQLANITVKDAANADVVFVAKSAAAGDGSYAQWRTNGPTPILSASFRARTQANGKGNARRFEATGAIPTTYTDSSGVVQAQAIEPFRFEATIPLNIAADAAMNNAHIIANLIASALVKEMIGSGYAAT